VNTCVRHAQSHDFYRTATSYRWRHLFLRFAAFFQLCKEDGKFEALRRGPIFSIRHIRICGEASRCATRYCRQPQTANCAAESQLQKSWESVSNFCSTIHCEILNSSITSRTRDSQPSASITLRVAPEDLPKLMEHLEKQGTIVQHTNEGEDKATAVVDTEARIKNLTGFRDNLRAMLVKPSATVKDAVDIQQQLTEVQSNLDSETAQRKILANETEKVAVVISFRIERTADGGGGFNVIGDALRESGSVLAESIASLITVVVAVIPWLIVILPLLWLLRKMWRKYRKGRRADQPPTNPPPAAVL